jgi:aspartyl-tRNA(Asn)/glutamyl-tRNA(Gln) amidotransferase subunit B
MEYEAVIGLETHVQLKTKSKMWCGCANQYGSEPNTNVCPVCLGMPGVLPVPNDEALRLTVLTGYLLNCEIPRFAKFDRKSYFYPDAPKNYQLTQYDKPSTQNGFVEFEFSGAGSTNGLGRVRITRAHLEEDVGKSFHFERNSGVDFNRAGVPLMEIVSEPDITSADMAYAYLNALVETLYAGGENTRVSDCDMEKGMVRCDVNISVRPIGTKELGAKIEIKNMNSFSGVRRAAEYEITRQIEVLKSGGKLIQSTRRWDDEAGITEEMRTKEHAHDYRYFPDPDLMPLAPTDAWLAEVRAIADEIRPCIPFNARRQIWNSYGANAPQPPKFPLSAYDSGALAAHPPSASLFLQEVSYNHSYYLDYAKPIANLILNNLKSEYLASGIAPSQLDGSNFLVPPSGVAQIASASAEKKISNVTVQKMIHELVVNKSLTAEDVKRTIAKESSEQVSDSSAIEKFCDEAIAANPNPVADYKAGKVAALNSLKGQVMKLSKGKANPALVGEILEKKLKG